MTLADLISQYERRRLDAERYSASAPLAQVFSEMLRDLRQVDGMDAVDRMLTTDDAAEVLGVARKTVAKWAADGRFPNAQKTSEGGEWRIPAGDVYSALGRQKEPAGSIPKLWEDENGTAA